MFKERKYSILFSILFMLLSKLHAQQNIGKENSETKRTLVYEVNFETGKSTLNSTVKEKLDRIYKVYQTNFTDTLHIKTAKTNDQLYKARSIAVSNYLIKKGVPQTHMRSIDFGKSMTGNGIEIIIKD